MQKITTFLSFNDQAEEAANFYCSIFKNAAILNITRYNEAGPGPVGSVMVVSFKLEDQAYVALNGGPEISFSMATSFMINCADQEEVDHYWDKLSAGGKTLQCGWLTDKFGLAWQVTPTVLMELMHDKDLKKSKIVMEAMLQMDKIDIKKLQDAAAQVS